MNNDGRNNRCQIERVGEVKELNSITVIISIHGKNIEVPATKVAEGIKIGEHVVWSGTCWNLRAKPSS
ncbi:hypothetical protein [Paenibacillus sp. LPE1-1-1.1]|uniref:hypothetical protein n=1 Tax=Paenibacillus sp. LPE1-1-1.1 TaxID=3135230 RepID=UPI00341AC1A8